MSTRRPTLSSFNNKSSVLCPKTTHITSQYLALEQLEAHHRMVSKAKGEVDTSAPRSLQSYLSKADRKKKKLWRQIIPASNSHERLDELSDCSLQKGDNFNNDQNSLIENADNQSVSLNKSIQAGFPMPSYESKVADKITWYLEAVSQGEFHQPLRRDRSPFVANHFYGSEVSLSSSMRQGKIVKGDLLDWHKKCFTSEKTPFSPRILVKNTTHSKLLDMRCYNNPRKHGKGSSLNSSDTFESDEEVESNNSTANESDVVQEEEKDDENEENFVSTVDNTLSDHNVEHQEWFPEKTSKFQNKMKQKLKSDRKSFPTQAQHSNLFSNLAQESSLASSLVYSNEDEKCLKLLYDVTEDILRSGIYTDKAIQRTFEFHLQFYPKENDEAHLRKLLDQIIEVIKVSNDDSDEPFKAQFFSTEENFSNCYLSTNIENSDAMNACTMKNENVEVPQEKSNGNSDEDCSQINPKNS